MILAPRTLAGLALSAFVGVAAGCGRAASADEVQLAADGDEAMMSSQQSTNLASIVFESVTEEDPVEATTQVVEQPAAFWPRGCATVARDGADPHVAHVTFHDCTGPFGLAHLDGEEVIAFSVGQDAAVHADVDGVSLRADGRPITYTATAEITVAGPTRRVGWQGSWTRVDEMGHEVMHVSDLNLDVEAGVGCRVANGTAKTMVASREVDTTISDYEACRNADGEEACPSGTVTHTRQVSGRSVTIELDTTDKAEVTGALGASFPVKLACPAADR